MTKEEFINLIEVRFGTKDWHRVNDSNFPYYLEIPATFGIAEQDPAKHSRWTCCENLERYLTLYLGYECEVYFPGTDCHGFWCGFADAECVSELLLKIQ